MTEITNHAPHGEVSVDDIGLAQELPGSGQTATPDIAAYSMRLGDDALILSQQLGWWVARGPELEEDLALSNIALDLLGHARALLHYAGTATGRSEDDLAFWRDEHEFKNCWLVEQPNGHFGDTIARQFLFSAYQAELYRALLSSSDPTLSAIAGKAEREVRYHLDHSTQWIMRLAGGTEESRHKITVSLRDLWPYLDELFADDLLIDRLEGTVPRNATLRPGFENCVLAVLGQAELEIPQVKAAHTLGRAGAHSTLMGSLLAELQWLPRRHPGASW